jgi:hypothetical protein
MDKDLTVIDDAIIKKIAEKYQVISSLILLKYTL